MLYSLRRLALGLLLIAATSAILLVADWRHRRPSAARTPASAPRTSDGRPAAAPPPASKAGRTWRATYIDYTESTMVEDCQRGFFDELPRLGLVLGRDVDIKRVNAQGNMPTLTSLVDSAVSEAVDLILLTSTPALQAAAVKVKSIPLVFDNVADPVRAGAGKSATEHQPNITGVATPSDYTGMARVIKQCLPTARRVGTLYNAAEDNAVHHKDEMTRELGRLDIELVAIAVAGSAEVADAALALGSRQIDAFCQVNGNVTDAAFAGIAIASQKLRRPLFAFTSGQARKGGAAVAVSRDYEQAGRDTAALVARIMRGESPASIPFQIASKTKIVVNLASAARSGLKIPPALLARADEVVE